MSFIEKFHCRGEWCVMNEAKHKIPTKRDIKPVISQARGMENYFPAKRDGNLLFPSQEGWKPVISQPRGMETCYFPAKRDGNLLFPSQEGWETCYFPDKRDVRMSQCCIHTVRMYIFHRESQHLRKVKHVLPWQYIILSYL